MTNILKKICENKKNELEITKSYCSLKSLKKLLPEKKNRNFKKLIQKSKHNKSNNIIAEIKKSSPSQGIIIDNYFPEKIASQYEKSGAGAISILTERKFFNGNIDHISLMNNNTNLPILRKDFIIDAYQVYESKVFKADAILLIATILNDKEIKEFINIATDIGLDCIIEVHSDEEFQRAIKIKYPLIGINNRNLDTLNVDTKNTIDLIGSVSDEYTIIAESGIKYKSDLLSYNNCGIYNFLIGEAFLKSENINQKFKEFLS